ncbi:low temperature requirement protein A [uncultured Jatrophihabitans sp.]|uniref:low temperature requirement protein A n=1 Tax=uncultured Jatrophihabitans sp. TaxID=1610747 RepID=UPI0035CBBCC5
MMARVSRPEQRNPGLELFFDLVFVLCVAQLADVLHEGPSWRTAARVVLLFVPVWWTWTGVTFALNRFPSDDNITTVLLLLAAGASGLMALAVPEVPGASDTWFAAGYLTVRLVIAVIYVRVREEDQRLTAFYATGFTLTAAAWFVSIFLPESIKMIVWIMAMIVDILIPAVADRLQRMLPVDERHLPDRFAAFAIIVLGEAAVNTVSVVDRPLQPSTSVVLAEGFVIAALLWWGFFDRHAWRLRYRMLADQDNSGRIAFIICAYLHFPLVLGVIFVGAGTQLAAEHADGYAPGSAAAMIAGGIGAYLLTLNAMGWVLRVPRSRSLATPRAVLMSGLVALLLFGHGLKTPTWLLACVGALVVHSGLNISRARKAGPTPAVRVVSDTPNGLD